MVSNDITKASMVKVITYGTYDLLHQGHINLLRRAKELGDYLIVGVTSDTFDRDRGKLNVCNNVLERVEAVKATGYADEVIIEDYVGQKIDDVQRYNIDIFAIGSDWEGKFDYLGEYCKVVYLPRTEGISSTLLRQQRQTEYKFGIIGSGRIAHRFVPESHVVNGAKAVAIFNPDAQEAALFAQKHSLEAYSDFNTFLDHTDMVYIASPHLTHYDYAKRSLLAGKHVLCEIPFMLKKSEAEELFRLAEERGLVLMEASKTAFCPAFCRMVTLVKSGIIGDVVDVKSSLSKQVLPPARELDPTMAGGAMTEHAALNLLAIFRLLGTRWRGISFHTKRQDGVDIYTSGSINYPHATSSFTLGIGVKTEGNLVVSGTKGYVYVPSPWWLTSFFEVRFEDQTKNKKYFYSYDGDGLRYEIQEFLSMIVNGRRNCHKLKTSESIAIAEVIEKYRNNEHVTEI